MVNMMTSTFCEIFRFVLYWTFPHLPLILGTYPSSKRPLLDRETSVQFRRELVTDVTVEFVESYPVLFERAVFVISCKLTERVGCPGFGRRARLVAYARRLATMLCGPSRSVNLVRPSQHFRNRIRCLLKADSPYQIPYRSARFGSAQARFLDKLFDGRLPIYVDGRFKLAAHLDRNLDERLFSCQDFVEPIVKGMVGSEVGHDNAPVLTDAAHTILRLLIESGGPISIDEDDLMRARERNGDACGPDGTGNAL